MCVDRYCFFALLLAICAEHRITSAADQLPPDLPLAEQWEIASTLFRQAYSSVPALEYERTLQIEYAPDLKVDDPPRKCTAHIWMEDVRCAIMAKNEFAAVTVHYWYGFDGKVFTNWSRTEKHSQVETRPPTLHRTTSISERGLFTRELTIRRAMGQYLGQGELSLFELIEGRPESVILDAIGNVNCLKAEFTNVSLSANPGSLPATISVWIDPEQASLPKRFRVQRSLDSYSEIEILAVTEILDRRSRKLLIPESCALRIPKSVETATFSNVNAVGRITENAFTAPQDFGTQIIDDTTGVTNVSFIGGDEGEREFLRRAGAPSLFISAKVDKDPAAMAALQRQSAGILTPDSDTDLYGPATTSQSYSSVILGAMACVSALGAVWWYRFRS
jgi:hypothetical protein